MMNLSSEEKSLPQKISEDIIELILEENLQPGDKLPNETILSERLNAGRSSVREAMKLLASRNIVTIRQGSGTDRKSTRLNSSHIEESRMPSSA